MRRRTALLVGVWILGLALLARVVAGLIWVMEDRPIAGVVLIGLVSVLCLLAILVTAKRWQRSRLRRSYRDQVCTRCGYSLVGVPVEREKAFVGRLKCPECGEEFPKFLEH